MRRRWWRGLTVWAWVFWWGCADRHALQVGVTCRYEDNPRFDQESHGRIFRAKLPEFSFVPTGDRMIPPTPDCPTKDAFGCCVGQHGPMGEILFCDVGAPVAP